jgi:hypothetical protein
VSNFFNSDLFKAIPVVGGWGDALGSWADQFNQNVNKNNPVTSADQYWSPDNPGVTGANMLSSNSNDIKKAAITPQIDYSTQPLTRESADPTPDAPPADPQQVNQIAELIKTLQQNLSSDPYNSGPYVQSIQNAYGQANQALDQLSGRIQGNAATSGQAINQIYQGGIADQNAEADGINQRADQMKNGLDSSYNGAIQTAQNDRSQALNERANLLKSLGIESAGLGDTGNVQTQAVDQLNKGKVGADEKAESYRNIDLDTNKNQVYGLRGDQDKAQANLRSQLLQALTGVDTSRAQLSQQQAQAMAQAQQQSYQDWLGKNSAILGQLDKQQQYALAGQKNDIDAAKNIFNSRVLSSMINKGSSGSMNPLDSADQYVSGQGGNSGVYRNAYTNAISNYQDPTGGSQPKPTDQAILNAMARTPGIDMNQALQYIRMANMAPTAATTGVGGMDMTPYLMMMMGGGNSGSSN